MVFLSVLVLVNHNMPYCFVKSEKIKVNEGFTSHFSPLTKIWHITISSALFIN